MDPDTNKQVHESPKKNHTPRKSPLQWWNARSKRMQILMIGIIVVLIILIIFSIVRMVTIATQGSLLIELTPKASMINALHGETVTLETTTHIYLKPLCHAECNARIIDHTTGRIPYNETFTIKGSKTITHKETFILEQFGSGQTIYQYEIVCMPIATNTCPISVEPVMQYATLIVNYEPTLEEKEDIAQGIRVYHAARANMSYVQSARKDIAVILAQESFPQKMQYQSSVKEIETQIVILERGLDAMQYALKEGNSTKIKEYTLMQYDTKAWQLYNTTETLYIQVNMTRAQYNTFITLQEELLAEVNAHYRPLQWNTEIINATMIARINNLTMQSNEQTRIPIAELLITQQHAITAWEQIKKDMINTTQKTQGELITLIIIESTLNTTTNSSLQGYALQDVQTSLQSVNEMDERCAYLKEIDAQLADIMATNPLNESNSSKAYRAAVTYRATERIITLLEGLIKQAPALLATKLNMQIIEYKLAQESLRETDQNITTIPVTDVERDREVIRMQVEGIAASDTYCKKVALQKVLPLTQKVIPEIARKKVEHITESFSMPQVYCRYGACNPAIDLQDNTVRPLLLIHGHSFSSKSSAYTSPQVFSPLVKRLVQEKRYIAGGIPDSTMNSISINLTRTPPVLQPTYYVSSYNSALGIVTEEGKEGNIDTYALRLRDIIEETKRATGSSEVDIVAHSMGGLVVRRYIQIFGSSSIHTFIMVGTPNQGIDEKTYTFCKMFGENNECEDMRENSLLLKQLNAPGEKLPARTYTITGSGCSMSGSDGDGIVTTKSVQLKGVPDTTINGTCTATGFLHSNLLTQEEYLNQTHKLIITLLQE